jgi:hypothetical protein
MPRFHFHLSAPDQDFQDNLGFEITDVTAAHSRAVQLAGRVMMFSAFADHAPDFRRWTVKVTDDSQRPVITVIFPVHGMPKQCKSVRASGARTLLQRLDENANAGRFKMHSTVGKI